MFEFFCHISLNIFILFFSLFFFWFCSINCFVIWVQPVRFFLYVSLSFLFLLVYVFRWEYVCYPIFAMLFDLYPPFDFTSHTIYFFMCHDTIRFWFLAIFFSLFHFSSLFIFLFLFLYFGLSLRRRVWIFVLFSCCCVSYIFVLDSNQTLIVSAVYEFGALETARWVTVLSVEVFYMQFNFMTKARWPINREPFVLKTENLPIQLKF